MGGLPYYLSLPRVPGVARERDNREWIMSSPGTLGRLMIHSPADAGCYPIDFLFILSFGYLHLQASKNEAMEVTPII
jgi:hypothetical protein